MGDYLRLYRSLLDEATEQEGGLTLLADPYSPEELGWSV